jgi:hypothetical protein
VSEEQRSAEARARAERALILLMNELGDDQPFIVVLGGLVPEVLARDADGTIPGHLGTCCPSASFARTRAADKDYYDLIYVLLHNRAGGPEQAAEQLLAGVFAVELDGLRSTFIEIRERYGRPSDSGPIAYAGQALLVDPEADEASLRADAVDVAQRFAEGGLSLLAPASGVPTRLASLLILPASG